MFTKVLIANRGAIACRIIRTLRRMGIGSVAVFSDADAGSLHVRDADEAIHIGPSPAAQSYLRGDVILSAAKAAGVQAIHPGYGFLSENVDFALACEAEGIAFIGPTADNIRAFGLKHTARALAKAQGVPLAPGTDLLTDPQAALAAAAEIGFPVILKATAGGGGIGMKVCETAGEVAEAFAQVQRLAKGNFSDGGVFLERYVRRARHVEVQVFGDGTGKVVALGERDCSLQRRNQKVIEETPAPLLPPATRAALLDCAKRLAVAVDYQSAGTVEFLYDADRDDFFFLEVNTRLQVEHGVTEQVTGIDLVEWMIRGAAGDFTFLDAPPPVPVGASIQARLYAEDPALDYRPSSGLLTEVAFPSDARVETWVADGAEVSSFYDPLLAKLIVTAPDRAAAVKALQLALDRKGQSPSTLSASSSPAARPWATPPISSCGSTLPSSSRPRTEPCRTKGTAAAPMPRLLNIRPNRGGRLLLGMAPLAGLVVLYLVASTARHAANPHDKLLPAFSQMAEAVKLMASVDPLTGRAPLLVDTLASLARLGAGLGIATITALLLGLALGLTVMMVTHDIKEAFKLGTRVLAFDKRRRDPQAPHRYGATAVYDFPVEKRGTVPVQAAALFSDA